MNNKKNLYLAGINRVIDYIDKNLDKDMNLAQLSRIANFSEFHFHRIFRAFVNEPLNKFIQRLRIERGANYLLHHPHKTITEIAFDCGFSSSQFFARTFKQYFSQNASEWRAEQLKKSKIVHTESKNVNDSNSSSDYIEANKSLEEMMVEPISVEVKDQEIMYAVYLRHIGPYKGDVELFKNLFTRLFTWAQARGLIDFPQTKVISLYNDNPDITDDSKLRVTACLTVPENTPVDGDVGYIAIEGGLYAFLNFEVAVDQYESAWDYVYGQWFPMSGYLPDDKPSYEEMLNDPNEHPEHRHIINICVPVKPQ